MSAAEFLAQAESVSSALRSAGAEPGSRIALRLPVGPDLLVAMVAVWLAECSFVPVDPLEAPSRSAAILEDSAVSLVLRDRDGGASPVAAATMRDGRIFAPGATIRGGSPHARGADEAYVIYTSGSTGRPKGVSVGHGALWHYLDNAVRLFGIPEQGMLFPVHLPPTFDAGLTSLLPPLVTRNVAVPLTEAGSGTRALAGFLRQAVSPVLVKTTPSQLRILSTLLTEAEADRIEGVFVIGGEQLDYADVGWLRRGGRVEIFNEYGPTEATVGCSAHRITSLDPRDGPVPIGRPHQGVTFTIDAGAGERPAGDTAGGAPSGELIISGPCLAAGYVGEDGPGPFILDRGVRRYRTGDRVTADPAVGYRFLGRTDDQVKIDGFRVELGEVEAALRAEAQAPGAAVLLDGAIVAAVAAESALDLAAVAAGLRGRLPAFMRPIAIHRFEQLPMTPHGKLDRAALAAEFEALEATSAVAPGADGLTTMVAGHWCDLLGIESVSAETDFFAADGHSIMALRLVGRLSAQVGWEVPVGLVFDHPTFEDFVRVLRDLAPDRSGEESDADVSSERAVSAPQRAILGAQAHAAQGAMFTVVDAVRLSGVERWESVAEALCGVFARHELFRWGFALDAALQVVARVDPLDERDFATVVRRHDLRGMPRAAAEEFVTHELAAARSREVDIFSGERPYALLFRTGSDEQGREGGVAAVVAHHCLLDEYSVGLLWDELAALVVGVSAETGDDAHYAQWAVQTVTAAATAHARNAAEELCERLLAQPLGALEQDAYSLSGVRPTEPDASRVFRFEVGSELAQQVARAARGSRVPAAAVYGAATARALARWMSGPDFVLHLPMTLRRTEEDFAAVGCFAANVPVLARVGDPVSAAEAVTSWQASVRFSADRGHADPEEVAATMRAARPAWAAAPTVAFVLESGHAGRHGHLTWNSLPPADAPAKHGLVVFLNPGDGTGRVAWNAGVFDAGSADRFAGELRAVLADLCKPGDLPSIAPRRPTTPRADPVSFGPSHADPTAPDPEHLSRGLIRQLIEIVSIVLGRELEPDESVFDAGIRSLDLERILLAVDRDHAIRLNALDVFDHPTPAALAALIHARIGKDAA